MRALLPAVLASCLLFPSPVLPATPGTAEGLDSARARSFSSDALERAVAVEVAAERRAASWILRPGDAVQASQDEPSQRSWIRRHPALFGSLVGFGAGFVIGYVGGRPSARGDPSSDYLTPEEGGLLVGGVGAGVGAVVGWAIAR